MLPMLSALKHLLTRLRDRLLHRQGDDPAKYFDLRDRRRLNKLLREAKRPPLRKPPAPDLLRGERALRVWELAPDLREAIPLGLTPAGREQLLRWAVFHSEGEHYVPVDSLLALLAHLDSLPDRGLELTYRLTPEWQRDHPDALTPAGWPTLQWYVNLKYKLAANWVAAARLTHPDPPPTPLGVNVAAHFDYASGLQQAATGLVDALHGGGFDTSLRDLPVMQRADSAAPRKLGAEKYDTTIVVAAVNTFADEWYHRAGLWLRPGVRRIANWYWEMEEVPAEWVPRLGWADEVWAPTRYTADAFRKAVTVPVRAMLPGLELPSFAPLPRSHFGLPADRFVFLFTFDMHSTMARKNPLGLVAAFRKAFRPDEPVELIIKVSRGERHPAELARLSEACGAAGVRLLNAVLPRDELLALMAVSDSYVSLHRAEGLGLGMAEAMLLGKPVVGSGYSGNLDFMTDENSYLVRCGRVACPADAFAYKAGLTWGDPDLDHAAAQMRRVYDHRDEARAKGERAKREAGELFSMAAYAARVRHALSYSGGGENAAGAVDMKIN